MPAPRKRSLVNFSLGVGAACLIAGTPALAGETKLRNAQVETLAFTALEGWKDDDHAAAYQAFQKSCIAILQGSKAMRAARPVYGALFAVCERASAAGTLERDAAREFFEANFNPVRIAPPGQTEGFFTGYYETEVDGSRAQTAEYNVPLYTAPASTIKAKKGKVFANLDRTRSRTARWPEKIWKSAG